MSYRFDLPSDVENQIYDCALYIAQDNPERALTWIDEAITTMRTICDMPNAHAVDEKMTAQIGLEIRSRPFGNYLIYYRVDETEKVVQMHLFIHAKRER